MIGLSGSCINREYHFQEDNEISCLLFNQILKAIMNKQLLKFLSEKVISNEILLLNVGGNVEKLYGLTGTGGDIKVLTWSLEEYSIDKVKPILYPAYCIGKDICMGSSKEINPILEFTKEASLIDQVEGYSVTIEVPFFVIRKGDSTIRVSDTFSAELLPESSDTCLKFYYLSEKGGSVAEFGDLLVNFDVYNRFPFGYTRNLIKSGLADNVLDYSINPYSLYL